MPFPTWHDGHMSPRHTVLLATARTYSATGQGRSIRIRARLSQRDIARAIGSTEPVICRWETGQRMPSGEAAVKWAELLNQIEEEVLDKQPAAAS